MNPYKNASFLKLALRYTIVFFVLVTFIRLFMGFFRFDGIEGVRNEYFYDGKWKVFLRLQIILSIVYGLLLAGYYKYIKK